MRNSTDYVPREGIASFCAGPRIANFDRVEWLTTPDPATQAAALQRRRGGLGRAAGDGPGAIAAKRPQLRVEVVETTGLIGVLRFNHLYPPFDNPAIRRAALKAVNQKEFMTAVAGEADPGVINDHVGLFRAEFGLCLRRRHGEFQCPPDLAALRKRRSAAGYNGEKVVFLGAADVPRITAICEVGADMLARSG